MNIISFNPSLYKLNTQIKVTLVLNVLLKSCCSKILSRLLKSCKKAIEETDLKFYTKFI